MILLIVDYKKENKKENKKNKVLRSEEIYSKNGTASGTSECSITI